MEFLLPVLFLGFSKAWLNGQALLGAASQMSQCLAHCFQILTSNLKKREEFRKHRCFELACDKRNISLY